MTKLKEVEENVNTLDEKVDQQNSNVLEFIGKIPSYHN